MALIRHASPTRAQQSMAGHSHTGSGEAASQPTMQKSGCSVGMGCVVGKGASLGQGAALAAGSVLPAGTSVPAGQVWAGNPAVKVGEVGSEDAEGAARTAELTAELGKLHMEEAWKELALVEQEHDDYKRERERTPDRIASLRYDPQWVPLPSLGEQLSRLGIHSVHYTPP